MSLGFVYFVFLPSMLTTPFAGRVAARFDLRISLWAGLGIAALGLPLLLLPSLGAVLAGMTLAGVGTFFAQAIGTGFVGRAAQSDRAAASGLYLASYYAGGLSGAFVLGQAFDHLGWTATIAIVGAALGCAALLGIKMTIAAK
jgi:predicted MFS family arabinose efflux permease